MITSMSRQHKLMAALAVVPLVFAACGGSSSDGSTADSWCDFADEADVVDEILSSLGADSSDVEAGITQMELFVQRLPDEAPDEIKEPAKKFSEGTQMLVDAIRAADYPRAQSLEPRAQSLKPRAQSLKPRAQSPEP